jgi:uncharacterized protein YndB with AHSA1/START domain
MTPTTDTQPGNSDEAEIVSSRFFAAPRELVFEAFSNPGHLVHWWGPEGFTNTFHEFDMRPVAPGVSPCTVLTVQPTRSRSTSRRL